MAISTCWRAAVCGAVIAAAGCATPSHPKTDVSTSTVSGGGSGVEIHRVPATDLLAAKIQVEGFEIALRGMGASLERTFIAERFRSAATRGWNVHLNMDIQAPGKSARVLPKAVVTEATDSTGRSVLTMPLMQEEPSYGGGADYGAKFPTPWEGRPGMRPRRTGTIRANFTVGDLPQTFGRVRGYAQGEVVTEEATYEVDVALGGKELELCPGVKYTVRLDESNKGDRPNLAGQVEFRVTMRTPEGGLASPLPLLNAAAINDPNSPNSGGVQVSLREVASPSGEATIIGQFSVRPDRYGRTPKMVVHIVHAAQVVQLPFEYVGMPGASVD
ncbi:MAG: hypothetical protein ACREJO_12380 [Phycisphaerales bacterium]